MKKYYSSLVLICICLMAACLLPQYAHADAPQDLALSYNMQTQTLTVTITHKSFFTGTHYIKQVEIKKNNKERQPCAGVCPAAGCLDLV